MQSSAYSLWLQPSGPAYDHYQEWINKLTAAHGTSHFEPHVTVLGQIQNNETDVVMRTQAMANKIVGPVDIHLMKAAYGETYFQCIYLLAEDTDRLQKLYDNAKEYFNIGGLPNPSYMPHMSLLYGDYPMEIRQQIVASLPIDLTGSFEAATLAVVNTRGEEKDWHKIAAFQLGR
jgi:2'-5' RNA ligase